MTGRPAPWSHEPPLDLPSAVGQVANLIRRRILEGEIPPGTPLRESRMAGGLGTSRNTVREALRELQAGKLVRYHTHRGFFVPRLSPGDVADIYRVRRTLELGALREGFDRMGGCLQMLAGILDRMGTRPASSSRGLQFDLDMEFHATIVGLLESPRLSALFADTVGELRLSLIGFDRLHTGPGGLRKQHKALYQVFAKGSRKEARRLLGRHLETSERQLLEHLASR